MKNLDLLIPKENPAPKDSYSWATITQSTPLRIRIDGESEPLDLTPDSLTSDVTVGKRVWCQFHGRRVIVIGTAQ